MKPSLTQTEAIVLDVIDGRRSFHEGLNAVVAYQHAWNPSLSRYWERHGFVPSGDVSEDAIPGVPTDVFRHVDLCSTERPPTRTFRTSGTTHGARGESRRISTAAYDRGAVRHFRACVDDAPTAMPSLVFDPIRVQDSSLSHMVAVLADQFGVPASFHLSDDGLDLHGLISTLRDAHGPVVIFGTAYAFVHLLDAAPDVGALPRGSTIIETGGFKTRSRELSRAALYSGLATLFGVPVGSVRSEYSMTELSSQLYSRPDNGGPTPVFESPAWCRVTAVDPNDLQPVPTGTPGLLRFVDLANVDTVVAIQTSDVGVVHPDGTVALHGRQPGATPRGCSLAAEEILDVAADRRNRR